LKDIREKHNNNLDTDLKNENLAYSEAGKIFQKLLEDLASDSHIDKISIDINLECIVGATGVSSPQLSPTGFSVEEAIEMCYLIGRILGETKKLACISLCEYNPFVEDFHTGRIVASLFYYLSLGLSMTKDNRPQESI